jgi:large subunit ribosomal protein L44e
MKKPKELNRHCPFCNKHTGHKVSQAKRRSKGATHPLSAGSKHRAQERGEWKGAGNLGKYSKPPKPKMVGKKLSKKSDFRFTCKSCNKTHAQSSGIRSRKIELV